jgi:beta-1,4-mannosyl-glycoprotein beta-1,4-N-acetylglucosaminyltransferase
MRQNKQGIFIADAGWHFTYMGGVDRIKQKIESWGEQSLNQPYVKENLKENVKNALSIQTDIFSRPARFEKVTIRYGKHPAYLVDNIEEYSEFILE